MTVSLEHGVDVANVVGALHRVQDQIANACVRAGRGVESVRLIAVSKRHPAAAIEAAYAAGQRDFGENYVQELLTKVEALRQLPDLKLRLIGHLQRNKAKEVVGARCAVDTVDSMRLATALNDRALNDGTVIETLVQVNVAAEPQKSGVLPRDLAELVEHMRALPGLSLRGLMTIPPDVEDVNENRVHFAALRELAVAHRLPELSMGMSADVDAAIEEGSTMVRVGTAIFGTRG